MSELFRPDAIGSFRYGEYSVDHAATGMVTLTCHYALDDEDFVETISIDASADGIGPVDDDAVADAARLVHLLAGISYYKAAAPPVVEVGAALGGLRPAEIALLHAFIIDGLGEFAYRNDLDLGDVVISDAGTRTAPAAPHGPSGLTAGVERTNPRRPLVPFGGGIDSIVTVEGVRRADDTSDAALFVMSRAGDRFAAIEGPAAATGLPVVRAGRQLDPKILESAARGYRNGHVPVTGVLSAIAVLAAAVTGRDAVVMSNEWSASIGNVEHLGREVNHQWSKSLQFEELLRDVLGNTPSLAGIDYFSWLRPFSELWVAERFATLGRYHDTFRSCNRSFRLDPATRLDRWCGECDKCCFIDLILSPFLPAETLRRIFDGAEPLANPALVPVFRSLLGLSADAKPFECVGDVDECRVAVLLAADRADRTDDVVLAELAAQTRAVVPGDPRAHAARLAEPLGVHHLPPGLLPTPA